MPNEKETLTIVRCVVSIRHVLLFAERRRCSILCYICEIDGFTALSPFHESFRSWFHDIFLQFFKTFRLEVLRHPPYSPDLSPCDSHNFGPLKKIS